MRKSIPEFDLMRAMAIVVILFHHLPGHGINYFDLRPFGIPVDLTPFNDLNRYFALGIFVFISGFLLEHGGKPLKGVRDALRFLAGRAIRLLPLYLVALGLFLVMFRDVLDPVGPLSLLIHACGLQILLATRTMEPVFTLWYVGLILAYYLVFLALARCRRSWRMAVVVVAGLAVAALLLRLTVGVGDKRFIQYLPVFAAGVLAARYGILARIRAGHVLGAGAVLLAGSAVYVGYVYPRIFSPTVKPALFSPLGLGAMALSNLVMLACVVLVWHLASRRASWGEREWVRRLSCASYCMYLFHRPVWWCLSHVTGRERLGLQLAVHVLVGIPLVAVGSWYLQRAYDAYPQRFLRTFVLREGRSEAS